MRTDIPAIIPADGLILTLWPTASPYDLVAHNSGLDQIALTPFATETTQTDSSTSIRLTWSHDEFSGSNRPLHGWPVSIRHIDGYDIWHGILDSFSGEKESRGERSMTLVCRSRDSTPWWRELTRIGPVIASGSDLASMARDLCILLGLTTIEYNVPDSGIASTHSGVQLADHSAWFIFEQCLLPSNQAPFVDARGVFKPISRDVRREPDIVLTSAQTQTIASDISKSPITSVRVKWNDPELQRIDQDPVSIKTVGIHSSDDGPLVVRWSDDGRQRMDLVNTNILISATVDEVTLHRSYHISGLLIITDPHGGILRQIDSPSIFNAIFGYSIPTDSPLVLSEILFFRSVVGELAGLTGMSFVDILNNVQIELVGTPFDYAPVVNEQEAVDSTAPLWMEKVDGIDNDMIPNRFIARSVAVNELFYRTRTTAKATLTIQDDMRIEPGDILQIPDGRKFYVESYSRKLTRGASQLLEVSGFWSMPLCR